MPDLSNVAVGDELIVTTFAPRAPRHERATVEKVGRKWLTIGYPARWRQDRVCRQSGRLDGGGYASPGTARTPEQHKAWEHLAVLRTEFKSLGLLEFRLGARIADEAAEAAFLQGILALARELGIMET